MKKIKNILVPIDFSDTSKLLAEYATIFGVNFGTKIHVIHVVEDFSKYARLSIPHISIEKVTDEIYGAAVKGLEKFCAENFNKNIKFESILSKGGAHEENLNTAKKRDIDIIIIGKHGSSGLDKIFFGSTADRVLRGSKCPVMTVSI